MADIWNWARGFHLSMGNPQEHPEVWTRRYLSQFPDFFSDREAAPNDTGDGGSPDL